MKIVEYGKDNRDAILLLHGGGLSWWSYREAAQLLAHRFHVVIPILHGHPGSEAPFISIEHSAQDLISYIDGQLGGQVLLIGGLSLGGQVLLEMLSQREDICRFAVIESTLALPMKLTAALIKPAYALCFPLIKQRWFAKLQFKALHLNAELFEAYYADTSRISRRDMTAFLRANAQYRIKDTLAKCSAKALILVGSRERTVLKNSAKQVARCLPAARLEVLHHYYHGDCSINHPRQYAEKLMGLIDG